MNKDISRLNGLVKLNNGEYQEAIEIFENVISLAISKGMTEGISSNYLNIGLAYSKLNNVDKARNYFSQAMDKSVFNFGSIPPEYRTHEMCVKVIKRPFSPLARHIPEHCWTEELMLIAVTSNEGALEYIPKKYKTRKLYDMAVKNLPASLKYVPDYRKTREMCINAITQNSSYLEFVPEELKDYEICLLAVKNNFRGDSLQYIPDHFLTEELCEEIRKKGGEDRLNSGIVAAKGFNKPSTRNLILALCQNFLLQSNQFKTVVEVFPIYANTLKSYNINSTNPWGTNIFSNPLGTVSLFSNLCTDVWHFDKERISRNPSYKNINLNAIKENFPLFVLIALIDEFESVRSALYDSLYDYNDNFTGNLKVLYTIVNENCPFQSWFTWEEFAACAFYICKYYKKQQESEGLTFEDF